MYAYAIKNYAIGFCDADIYSLSLVGSLCFSATHVQTFQSGNYIMLAFLSCNYITLAFLSCNHIMFAFLSCNYITLETV